MAVLLAGCETVLYLASRLRVYIEFWQQLPPTAAKDNLEESIVILYVHLLHFLGRAIQLYETSIARRVLAALWAVDDVVNFESTGHELATKVEFDASNCDRTADAQQFDTLSQLRHNMQQMIAELRQLHQLQTSLDDLHLKIDLGKIPYAKGAIFNSSDSVHTLCHPATRTDLLSQVQQWARTPDSRSIFWLHGGAGAGKSTISWTFSQWLTDQPETAGVQLGASFFFKRGESDRETGSRFFCTIIRQLILKVPGLDLLIANAIELDPFIFDKALAEQFCRLVLQPLQRPDIVTAIQSTLVIVVDALDECSKESDIRTILELWALLSNVTTKMRLFLTSRPELTLRMQFRRLSVDLFQDIDLVNAVPPNTIRQDLLVYLSDTFNLIRTEHNDRCLDESKLNEDWPGDQSIQRLVDISSPLFIVAATICRFVGDLEFDPRENLEEVLNDRNTGRMSQMEQTYLPVLGHLTAKVRDSPLSDRLCREFRAVVGSIILLAEPLSVDSLASLLEMTVQSIDRRLAPLHSVLQVPADHHAPIRTLHLSFAEYLLDGKTQERSFGVDASGTHMALGSHCLRVLSRPDGLREDICGLNHPGKLRHEVESTVITSRLSPVVQYACRYWIHHVKRSCHLLKDGGEVHVFLKKHFLHWLEALSLMDRISETIGLWDDLRSCLSATAHHLSHLLEDARRFILAHRYIIDLAPLQLYSSTMIFSPRLSSIRVLYGQIPDWIQQYPTTIGEWGPELQKLEGHFESVCDISFSPDGSLLASGSDDNTIRLWDTRTGREVQMFQQHSRSVTAVCFSPDGILASGSTDSTIRLWDVQTGTELRRLDTYEESVTALSFSADGRLLASGYGDGAVQIWSAETGKEIHLLWGHSREIYALAFSPDGLVVASGSGDRTIKVWDTRTGKGIQKLDEHTSWVNAVSFSPNGNLASASSDGKIFLWDIESGRRVKGLHGHQGAVRTVAFSHDGSVLASGSIDRTIRLWNPHNGLEITTFEGHSDSVNVLSFSPDGSLLASGSSDSMVQLWDTKLEHGSEKLEVHSNWITVVVFSPDGFLLASGSEDKTIRLWDTKTARPVHELEGHSDWITTLSFSQDGSLLASGSGDETISVWDVRTGRKVHMLDAWDEAPYVSWVTAISFSPDNSLLASGCNNRTITVWSLRERRALWSVDNAPVINRIGFVDDNILTTDQGAFNSSGPVALEIDSSQSTEEEMFKGSYEWVRRKGQNLLWLPRDYRGRVACYGDMLAIGADSGRVAIFRFKFEAGS